MPRRKKTDQSPARLTDGPPPPEWGSLGQNTGYHTQPQRQQAEASSYFIPSSASISAEDKEKVVKSMQEMFSHLDPDVIYIVLAECDFKVENAMDSLLELSVAAEVAAPAPPPVSGFERTAAVLLSPRHFSEGRSDPGFSEPSQRPSSPSSENLLTEDLDLLVDQELETLTAQQDAKEKHYNSKYLEGDASISSFPPPPFTQQALPELLQSSLESGSQGPFADHSGSVGRSEDRRPRASSPLNQLSTWGDEPAEGQQPVVDFTHLIADKCPDNAKPPFDLGPSGRPSAFQAYKKQEPSQVPSERPGLDEIGGARSKINALNQDLHSSGPSPWNLKAPVFSPRGHENQGSSLINPGAQTHPNWPGQPRHMSPWPGSQAPLKPNAAIPKSWKMPAAPQAPNNRLRLEGKVLVLLRGAPGSGKSTLARALLDHNRGGVVLSTDDYFIRNGRYAFDPTALGEAHDWNHKRAKEAFERGNNPIIIDNTNMQGWEMKPYVAQALRHGYKVLFREPDTWWKNKPRELERRTAHDVPVETIRRMLSGYERFVTVQGIMGSHMPEWKQRLILENKDNKGSQPPSSETPCPDLVDQPGLTEGCKKSRPQLFSSLPDVSSIGHSQEGRKLEDGSHKSTESLKIQLGDKPADEPNISDGDDLDLGELDSELDARLAANNSAVDQKIPDCIVESVMNEEQCGAEIPVAFAESIAQRVKRERSSRRSDFEKMDPVDLVKDTNQLQSKTTEKESTMEEKAEGVENVRLEEEAVTSKSLDFVGDWPSENPLKQRQIKKRGHKAAHEQGNDSASEEGPDKMAGVHSGPNVAEFQKLLDLIQTGIVADQTESVCSPSLSPSSGEKDVEDEAGSNSEDSHCEERERDLKPIRGELPDCVLDWKAADSCGAREPRTDSLEGPRKEDEVTEIAAETMSVDPKSTNLLNSSEALTDLSVVSKTPELSHNGADSHCSNSDNGTDVDLNVGPDLDRESRTKALEGSNDETCQTPVCETENSVLTEGSQERKQRQGRRSGKQCKLALTFTQNYPDSPSNTIECPNASPQSLDDRPISRTSDVAPSSNPASGLDLSPNLEPFTESKSEVDAQPPAPPLPEDTGCFTQTEPQDFALLWRLNRQNSANDAGVAAGSHCGDVTVVSGDSSRFVPELSSAVSAAAAVHPSGHREVPYRVVHEKGTQVEEKEFGVTQDHLESLRILSRHFKLVSFDTLEDLYEKCQQDLEWTTNLLLDSGERFFRDEDIVEEENECAADKASQLSEASHDAAEPSLCPAVLEERRHEDEPAVIKDAAQPPTCEGVSESGESANNTDQPDASADVEKSSKTEEERSDHTGKAKPQPDLEGGAWGGSLDDEVIIEELRVEDDIASMDEVNRVLQAELDQMEREEKQRKERSRGHHLNIQSVEIKLPTELALQLTELFGPVGIDPGACSAEDCAVLMDLNLAKLLHQKWKETIQERQKQASLSFHLLQESMARWDELQGTKTGQRDRTPPVNFPTNTDGSTSVDGRPEAWGQLPFMDHWNTSRPHISLRDIIQEEQALQSNVEQTRKSRADLDRRDGATLLKENQLFSLFPNIDRHFLLDIFRDHNYSLTQTELFLRSLLIEEPVKTVVAPEAPRSDSYRATSKEREKRQKALEVLVAVPDYQDTEDPDYEDFRAEANLQRKRQLESFSKAAEAYKQGRKEVASFYAQQGHLHGQRMREANHRAAAQIFERVNSSLLPNNILDLHGLHVDEALQHLARVLQDKTADAEQGLCRPQLSVITGRGNHSQGGVARIRPAVVDYLTNKHYRFTEPKPGLVLVSLK
ncbi:NEDD4-binding protein 2 [Salarias fasciatus]|uniref:NEDD4 binding protein 2 n=1 Tax=Salarias fasciatus TaxID=181472 RepID=A0A672JEG8_SALFA|nr:NEDD4-binding protein 2 [Salarias fasciatus]